MASSISDQMRPVYSPQIGILVNKTRCLAPTTDKDGKGDFCRFRLSPLDQEQACKCNEVFCKIHRAAEHHNCPHNSFGANRARLAAFLQKAVTADETGVRNTFYGSIDKNGSVY